MTGVANITNKVSRKFDKEKDENGIFNIMDSLVCQSIDTDLFATSQNFQVEPFVPWKLDPECFFVDTIATSWKPHFFCIPHLVCF